MIPANPDVTNTTDIEAVMHDQPLQPLPNKRGEPVFKDSWEAEAYAMGNILVKEGLVSRKQWMDEMAEAICQAHAAGDSDQGDTYYSHWCTALESLCFDLGFVSPEEYQHLLHLWGQAIANTPHGVALAIENAGLDSEILNHGNHHHHHDHDHGHIHGHSHGHGSEAPPPHYWTPIHKTALNKAVSDC
jgi:nitrile hydratase accessory protein